MSTLEHWKERYKLFQLMYCLDKKDIINNMDVESILYLSTLLN